MRLRSIILWLLLFSSIWGCAHDNEASKAFGNRIYFVSNALFGEKIKEVVLINGEHEEDLLNFYYDNKYVYGDFNHDGLKDAAVVVFENHGGNADYYQLAFLINDGKELVHRASYSLDTRAIINSVREKNGKVVVDMYVHQEGDCNAGPSKRVRNVYEYNGPDDFAANRKS